ncbi:M48 family metallopeptidase [Propionimicrobium sp. PCR01-08-3]|uniref:M48 metallopeptidase family protein n=1 Tax=Propionimicrobium sp. PCR01-08-3 TaxID=3052086 RepID=UPI00255CA1F7|nr:M48 family metallopeptidase [Propionimicrobium sp. PCR01-08-3]WIY83783.1 M48 family metallopeptidase [Propionimicrobium sp. PCR01-08-3]
MPPPSETLPTATLRLPPLPDDIAGVRVRRSARRRKTISARLEDGGVVVFLPAGMPAAREQEWIDKMVERIVRKRTRTHHSDEELMAKANQIARDFLDRPAGRRLRPSSVRWVTNMNHRWGSCSVAAGTIRLSDRLQQMPDWVIGYVLAHELAHLEHTGHTRQFWELVGHYPSSERAAGYLEGWSAAQATVWGPGGGGEIAPAGDGSVDLSE